MSAEKKSKTSLETLSETKVAGGLLRRVKHASTSTGTEMTFAVFTPEAILPGTSFPALYFLSGLTCDDTNFCLKAGAFQTAAKEGLAIVVPDTSPRGAGVEGEEKDWDLGTGAGFYVDATAAPWSTNYKMYTYITQELPDLVSSNFPISNTAVGITGHSMGGHGALSLALKNPSQYVSVSALAPICNPSNCPWGQKAFGAYFGPKSEQWAAHDSVELMNASSGLPFDNILIDQGSADKFLAEKQLLPEALQAAAQAKGQQLTIRMQDGFDHGYHFVAAFIADHIRFHAERLRKVHNQQKSASYRETEVPALLEEFAKTTGQPIKCKAMVAYAPNEALVCEEIFVAPPKAGEVRVKVIANALCHTDVYTWSGQDPEGLFPSILGHEGGCIVESVGEGVTSVRPGDKVIPCYTAMCAKPSCIFCMNPKTNLCPSVRTTQGRGQMVDGTSRFTRAKDGLMISHFMGCSTFAEYTVLAEVSCAKVDDETQLEKACLFGCGVSTGLGAVWNNCKVEPGSTVAVFGLGAVGLAVVQAAQMTGAKRIVGIDINPTKFAIARELGCTDCVNPLDHQETPIQNVICNMSASGYGMDYTFDCTGNVNVMRSAVECCHKGWGMSCIIGVAASGKEISTRPFQLVIGRRWIGTAFGGWKSRRDVPRLVRRNLDGTLPIDHFITHTLQGVDQTNEAIHILESGKCLRCVVTYF